MSDAADIPRESDPSDGVEPPAELLRRAISHVESLLSRLEPRAIALLDVERPDPAPKHDPMPDEAAPGQRSELEQLGALAEDEVHRLWSAALADADRVRELAAADAERVRDQAREQAERIRAQARSGAAATPRQLTDSERVRVRDLLAAVHSEFMVLRASLARLVEALGLLRNEPGLLGESATLAPRAPEGD